MSLYTKAINEIKGVAANGWANARLVKEAGKVVMADEEWASYLRRTMMSSAMGRAGKDALRGAGYGALAGAAHGALDKDQSVLGGAFKGSIIGVAAGGVYGGFRGGRAGYRSGLEELTRPRIP